ncbi:MAG: mechanosensitive ion channel family protein [Caldimicrobium sp.]
MSKEYLVYIFFEKDYILSIFLFLVVVFLSYLISKIILRYLLVLIFAKKAFFPQSEIIVKTLQRYILFWGIILGLHIALGFLKIPSHLFTILNKAFLILFILSLAFASSKLLMYFFELYIVEKTELKSKVTLFEILVKGFVFSIAFILILNILDINITPFVTTFGVAGLVIGLALRDTLENFFAGIQLIMSKQIKPKDFIRLESGDEGFVEDITWRNTTIRMLTNDLIIIPNSKLSKGMVINYQFGPLDFPVVVQVGVSYQNDLDKVERVTLEVAKEIMQTHPEASPSFEPFLRFHTFADQKIIFSVIMRCKRPASRALITHEFLKKLHKRYQEEKISLTSLPEAIV